MRAEKKFIGSEYVARLNGSPFFIVVDYRGLSVKHFTELRKRLTMTGAKVQVVKNSIFSIAAKEVGVADLRSAMSGQMAVVTGQKDVSAAAKVLKTFQSEFEKPKIQFGYLDGARLSKEDVVRIATLPSLDVLRATLMGALNAPASKLVRVLAAPGQQLARVIKAKAEKGE